MGKKLGMSPKNLGTIDINKSEQRKLSRGKYIEELYKNKFGDESPIKHNPKAKKRRQKLKEKKRRNKLKSPWAVAKTKYRLTARQIAMSKELGMTPKTFSKIGSNKFEPWKLPRGEFIENCYRKRFGDKEPVIYNPKEEKRRKKLKEKKRRLRKEIKKIIKEILKAVEEKQMKIKSIILEESKEKKYVLVLSGKDEKEVTFRFENKTLAENVLKDLQKCISYEDDNP